MSNLALKPPRRKVTRQTHFNYMTQRDDYRHKRGEGIKWQYAHMGLVDVIWHPSRLPLSKLATVHCLIYDKRFHGGNRAKIAVTTKIDDAI